MFSATVLSRQIQTGFCKMAWRQKVAFCPHESLLFLTQPKMMEWALPRNCIFPYVLDTFFERGVFCPQRGSLCDGIVGASGAACPGLSARACRCGLGGPGLSVRACRSRLVGPGLSVRACRFGLVGLGLSVWACRPGPRDRPHSTPPTEGQKSQM